MCYKENKSLFFDVMKNGHIFPLAIFNMILDCFLVEEWGTLERARRYV